MKKNEFEAWSTVVFMRGLDKRKYGELIHDLSIKYAIKKNQNLKHCRKQWILCIKWNLKQKRIMIKLTHTKQNKNWVGERDKSNERSFAQTKKHEKKCYCCGSGAHMLNNCEIWAKIARDQWFDRTVNVHSKNQKEAD